MERVEKLAQNRKKIVWGASESVVATMKSKTVQLIKRRARQLIGDTFHFFTKTTRMITNTLEGALRYDVQQTLSSTEKEQAAQNAGLFDKLLACDRPQTLTEAQKTRAKLN